MTRILRLAPAKINLALHVVGQRADGYHELDSLVGFTRLGDKLSFAPAEDVSLSISGPFGGSLSCGADNLILRAASALGAWAEAGGMSVSGAAITLDKRLPIASGIGGGSADAAAALRGLAELWSLDIDNADLARIGLSLGADVPMCLEGRSARIGSIGDHIAPAPSLPACGVLLANPGVAVSTPDVFRALQDRNGSPLTPLPASWQNPAHLADWINNNRNDLAAPAITLQPVIADVLSDLTALDGTLVARMSGSGATCFALFEDETAAGSAARRLAVARPGWWIAATGFDGQPGSLPLWRERA